MNREMEQRFMRHPVITIELTHEEILFQTKRYLSLGGVITYLERYISQPIKTRTAKEQNAEMFSRCSTIQARRKQRAQQNKSGA